MYCAWLELGQTGRQIEPEVSLHIAARNALSERIQHAQRPLRSNIALIGSLSIPRSGLLHIARKTLAIAVTIELGQVQLAADVLLVRGFAVPLGGLLAVARHAFGVGIALAHLNLGGRVAGDGLRQQCRVDSRSLSRSLPMGRAKGSDQ